MKKTTLLRLTVMSLFFMALPVRAGQTSDDGCVEPAFTAAEISAANSDPLKFTIDPDSIRVVRKAHPVNPGWEYLENLRQASAAKNPAVVVIGEIVNIALKVWDIVKENAPVVDIDSKYASAMPKGIESWAQLNGWNSPAGAVYGFYANNAYGQKWVDIEYKVLYTSGGRYNGKGRYLTGVTVIPTKVDVNWGTHVTLSAQVPDSTIVNIGTTEDPVAAMQIVLTSRIKTVMSNLNSADVYYIDGNGNMQDITKRGSSPKVTELGSAAPLAGQAAEIFR